MLRGSIAAGLVALALAGFTAHAEAQEVKAGNVTVVTPWARATPGGAKVGGAYLELKAAPGGGDRLVAVKSPVAGTVEMHSSVMESGIMKMRRVDGIEVPAGKTVTLEPGGYHLMLMDLKQQLKQGGKVPLTLVFEKAGEVNVDAAIAPIGAKGPSGAAGKASSHAGHGSGSSKAKTEHKH